MEQRRTRNSKKNQRRLHRERRFRQGAATVSSVPPASTETGNGTAGCSTSPLSVEASDSQALETAEALQERSPGVHVYKDGPHRENTSDSPKEDHEGSVAGSPASRMLDAAHKRKSEDTGTSSAPKRQRTDEVIQGGMKEVYTAGPAGEVSRVKNEDDHSTATVRRRLWNVNHEEVRKSLKKDLHEVDKTHLESKSASWNFDFKSEVPQAGRWRWEKIQDAPRFYQSKATKRKPSTRNPVPVKPTPRRPSCGAVESQGASTSGVPPSTAPGKPSELPAKDSSGSRAHSS